MLDAFDGVGELATQVPVMQYLATLLVGTLIYAFVLFVIPWVFRKKTGFVRMLRRMRVAGMVLVLLLVARIVGLDWMTPEVSPAVIEGAERWLTVLIIGALAWTLIMLVTGLDDLLLSRHRVDVADNHRARRVHTQTKVLVRTLVVIIAIVAGAWALMTFPDAQKVGLSLLTSAGVFGLIIGLAARPTVENLLAGLQIAFTGVINLDDVVIVEGEWGWIEEIRATYVVVKIWDQRRLVVPLHYFIQQPFQNWTRRTADLLGTVFLKCDYTVNVDRVRAELKRLVERSDLWDTRVAIVQVTDASEKTVELRALVSASSSPRLWDLRVYVREGLIQHLQREQPGALPQFRAHVRESQEADETKRPAEAPHSERLTAPESNPETSLDAQLQAEREAELQQSDVPPASAADDPARGSRP